MRSEQRFYRLSGAVPPQGALLGLLFGTGGAFALSFVYAYGVRYIPFVFLSLLVSLGYLFGVSMLFQAGLLRGHVRNQTVSYVLAFVMGVIALYLAWVAFLFVLLKHRVPYTKLLLDPMLVWKYVSILAVKGWFSFKGSKVSGGFYTALLVGEALLYLGFVTGVGALSAVDTYCERCKQWLGLPEVIALADELWRPEFEQTGKTGTEDWSNSLTYAMEPPWIHIDANACSKCGQLSLLHAKHVAVVEKKGEVEHKETPLFANLLVPRETIDKLVQGYEDFAASQPETPEEDGA